MLLRAFTTTVVLCAWARAQHQTVPPMSLQTFFLPDSEPLSLEASLKSTSTDNWNDVVQYWDISCPEEPSPENDACRSASIYPAAVYHTQGSIWGGTTTYKVDETTTTWRCDLGQPGEHCNKTIVAGGRTKTETSSFDTCYGIAHRLPMVVTAGNDLLPSEWYLDFNQDINATALNQLYQSQLSELNCPSSKTTMFAGAVARTTGEPSGRPGPTTAQTGSGASVVGTPTETDGAAESSKAPDGSGAERTTGGVHFLASALVIAAIMAAFLA